MTNTAVYLRVSTRQQDIDAQRGPVEQWLQGHSIEVPDHRRYIDQVWTRHGLVQSR